MTAAVEKTGQTCFLYRAAGKTGRKPVRPVSALSVARPVCIGEFHLFLHSPLRHARRCDTLVGEPFKGLISTREALPMRRRGLSREAQAPCIFVEQ